MQHFGLTPSHYGRAVSMSHIPTLRVTEYDIASTFDLRSLQALHASETLFLLLPPWSMGVSCLSF